MGSITTALVGPNAQPLAPGPLAGAQADVVTVINLDTANTVSLGSSPSFLPMKLGPLASLTLTAPVWAAVVSAAVEVGIVPGGASYSPGSLTITGPVTAEISGPVNADVTGTVAISSGTVDATVTGTVDISSGSVTATISGTPDVTISGTPTVDIGNTPSVTISGTPVVDIGTVSGSVDIASVAGTVAVSGSVSVTGTPTVSISGTPTVDIGTVSGSIDIASVAGNVDVVGSGGYVAPGAYSLVLNDTSTHTIAASGSYTTSVYDMQTYGSYTIAVKGYCGAQGNAGAPLCVPVTVNYYADAAATVLIDTERWWMWLGNSSSAASPIRGSGPLRGGWITVTIANPVGSEPVTVTDINVYGAGRSLAESVWQQSPPTGMTAGLTMLTSSAPLVPLPGDDKILANESNNSLTSSSSTYWLPLPLFAGQVSMYFQASVALGSDFVVASAQGLAYGDLGTGTSTQGVLWNPASAAGTSYTADIEVGHAPLYCVVHAGSTAPVLTFTAQGH